MAALSKAQICDLSLAGIAISNSAGCMDVCVLHACCVLSDRGLCVGMITRPEEFHRVSVQV